MGRAAGVGDGAGHLRRGGAIHIRGDHGGTGTRKTARNGCTDTGAGTGDQGDSVGESVRKHGWSG